MCHQTLSPLSLIIHFSVVKSIIGELQCIVDQRFGSINLRDQVSRDTSKLVGSGTYGKVYEGMLRPEQTKVAVKVVHFGNKSALPVLKVNGFHFHLCGAS